MREVAKMIVRILLLLRGGKVGSCSLSCMGDWGVV